MPIDLDLLARARSRQNWWEHKHMRKVLGVVLLVVGLPVTSSMVFADTWRGTAPFCDGECLPGEETIAVSDWGDGGYCVTGKKVLCRNASTTCQPGPTEASCYGVVMVCDNGCGSYGCGPCFGLDDVDILNSGNSAGPAVGLPCQSGYVWREAYAGDYVCVTPESRSRAAADNAAAAGRRAEGDWCVPGYVWREAVPADLVCVEPSVRSETALENELAAQRTVLPLQVFNDTCISGYVRREAIANDHVCVTPETRAQAWQDNDAAAQRWVAGSDTCISGYVWREVIPADHVCVTPEVRAAAQADNEMASARVAN